MPMMMIIPRTIVVKPNTSTSGVNLRTTAGSPVEPINCIVEINSAITSSNTSIPAIDFGTGWNSASNFNIINNSTITGAPGANGNPYYTDAYGAGGAGGAGGGTGTASNDVSKGLAGNPGGNITGGSGNNGGDGGIALKININNLIILKNNGSIIGGTAGLGRARQGAYGGGGGGGGGGSYWSYSTKWAGGGGGGGGSGSPAGNGGGSRGGDLSTVVLGSSGSYSLFYATGGAGGAGATVNGYTASSGGNGGGVNQAGNAGGTNYFATGGAGGVSGTATLGVNGVNGTQGAAIVQKALIVSQIGTINGSIITE